MAEVPLRVTTPLLVLITQQSLDEDYEHVAEQRAAAGAPAPGRQSHVVAAVVVLVFGLLIAVAAVQTARNADVASAGREQLISRIDQRRAVVADQQTRIADLRTSNAAADAAYRQLGAQLTATQSRREALAAAAGWSPVSGAGLRVTVDDATGGDGSGLVRDDDLALLTMGLWRAGARAIAVNGQRLTALSYFRNSAEVIRINGVPLSPPYVVEAIGTATTLRSGLSASAAGARFQETVNAVGLRLSVQNVSSLGVSAAPVSRMELQHAAPIPRKATSPSQEEMP